MALVLRGLTYLTVLCFVDDCIVTGGTFSGHLANVEEVLKRFQKAGLLLKPKKCKFFQKVVSFLGHVVSSEGIAVDSKKTAVIQQWPFPKNLTELRGFLGLTGFYHSYCKNYAEKASPLTEMLRKGMKVKPTERRLKAFNDLKEFLTSPPLLAMPQDSGEWKVEVDASSKSLGAILYQHQNGLWWVVEYASRTLTAQEERYCVTRKEVLAAVFGLRQFKSYLTGLPNFQLITDHQSIKYFDRTREPSGQLARFLEFLSNLNFTLEHRPGRQNVGADALSRIRPCDVADGRHVPSVTGVWV